MAFHASTCGHLSIAPPLNAAEHDYLSAFVYTRRHAGRGHPYDVPDNPAADSVIDIGAIGLPEAGNPACDAATRDVETYNRPLVGQPSLWCPWVPSCQGKCLSLEAKEKISAPVTWLQYLIDHFLAPEAQSGTSDHLDFADFTYDHSIAGGVALHSGESNELSFIHVVGFTVVEDLLSAGDPEPYGPSRGWVD